MDSASSSKLPDPMCLEGNLYSNWKKFKRDFNDYLTSIEFDEKPDKVKIAKLRNLIGDSGKQVIVDLQLEDSDDYNHIIDQFDEWAESKRNPIHDRSKFYNRFQEEGETFEDFFNDVKNLITRCNFGEISKELLRDKIATGILDSQLKDLLCSTPDISLESAVQMCRVSDLSEKQLLKLLSMKKGMYDADLMEPDDTSESSDTSITVPVMNKIMVDASVQTDGDERRFATTSRITVKNVSRMEELQIVRSPPCCVYNLPWKFLVQRQQNEKMLGVFLECNGESKDTSWSCYAEATFILLPQKEGAEPIEFKLTRENFSSKKLTWGSRSFIGWNDLLNPEKGYIKDDAITLKVSFTAEKPEGLNLEEPHIVLHDF